MDRWHRSGRRKIIHHYKRMLREACKSEWRVNSQPLSPHFLLALPLLTLPPIWNLNLNQQRLIRINASRKCKVSFSATWKKEVKIPPKKPEGWWHSNIERRANNSGLGRVTSVEIGQAGTASSTFYRSVINWIIYLQWTGLRKLAPLSQRRQ